MRQSLNLLSRCVLSIHRLSALFLSSYLQETLEAAVGGSFHCELHQPFHHVLNGDIQYDSISF